MARRSRTFGAAPGSIYRNGNRFWWSVKLPGAARVKAYPLIPDGRVVVEDDALRVRPSAGGPTCATGDRAVAEEIAADLWSRAVARAAGEPAAGRLLLSVLVDMYVERCRVYYRNRDGEQTREAANQELAVRPLKQRWPTLPAPDFTFEHLLELRTWLETRKWPEDSEPDPDLRRLTVSTVNKRVASVIRMFKWAAGERLVPARIPGELQIIRPLEEGRCKARSSEPVDPVPDDVIDATLPFLPPVVQAMVRVQRLTGMRSGELCRMTPMAIDRGGKIWVYNCRQYKNRHRKKRDEPKQIALGPRAQEILTPLLAGRPIHLPVFSPAEAQAQRNEQRRAERQSEVQPSQEDRRKAEPQKQPGDGYDRTSYYKAIAYAVRAANRARKKAAEAAGRKKWVRLPHWHPHQLRHAAADDITTQEDLKAAAAVLGHETLAMTAKYAKGAVERIKLARAFDVAERLG